MRVVQAEGQHLAALLDDHAVGARRQGQQAGTLGHRLHQQCAVGGAVEHAEVAAGVQGDEALAALFGGDLHHRGVAQLEVADVLEARGAVRIAGHEPLGDATLGVAHHQGDAAQQHGAGGDFALAVFQQLVAAVQGLLAQAEDIGLGATVEDVEPLVARVDVDGLDRLDHLRQLDAALHLGHFAGQHVLFADHLLHVQLGAGGTGQHQGFVVDAEGDVFQGAALGVQHHGRLTVGEADLGIDGLLVVRVGDLVAVLEDQRLAVGQAQYHQRAARLVLADGRHTDAGRQRQLLAFQQAAVLHREELHFALVGDAHAHHVLLFERQQQRLAGVLLQPRRVLHLSRRQLGALEQRQHHIGQVEEDQGDRPEHGEAANQHVPVGQAVHQCAHLALALHRRRVEVDAGGRGLRSCQGIGQVSHGFGLLPQSARTGFYDGGTAYGLRVTERLQRVDVAKPARRRPRAGFCDGGLPPPLRPCGAACTRPPLPYPAWITGPVPSGSSRRLSPGPGCNRP
ncbi:hypothetical protein D9M70_411950 [compost metagenome]